MAGGAAYTLVRRLQMRGELGLHNMAALAAELDGFHVVDRTVAQLASDNDVCQRHDGKEDTRAAPGGPPVGSGVETSGGPVSGTSEANRYKRQPGEEYRG